MVYWFCYMEQSVSFFSFLLLSKPKAMEHLRKKIEVATEKIHVAKLKEEEARKVFLSLSLINVSQCFCLSCSV